MCVYIVYTYIWGYLGEYRRVNKECGHHWFSVVLPVWIHFRTVVGNQLFFFNDLLCASRASRLSIFDPTRRMLWAMQPGYPNVSDMMWSWCLWFGGCVSSAFVVFQMVKPCTCVIDSLQKCPHIFGHEFYHNFQRVCAIYSICSVDHPIGCASLIISPSWSR